MSFTTKTTAWGEIPLVLFKKSIGWIALLSIFAVGMLPVKSAFALVAHEGMSSFDFNFDNPGARAVGMGGAFISLVDDATAAQSNPAGLVVLTRPEISIEFKYTEFKTRVFNFDSPKLLEEVANRRPLTVIGRDFEDDRFSPSFLSFIYPWKKFTFAVFRHELVNYKSNFEGKQPAQRVQDSSDISLLFPVRNSTTMKIVDVGVSAGYSLHEKISLGLTVKLSSYKMDNELSRFNQTIFGDPDFSSDNRNQRFITDEGGIDKPSFNIGVLVKPISTLQIGAVFKQGPKFEGNAFFEPIGAVITELGTLQFPNTLKIPDRYGVGISYVLFDSLTLSADWEHIEYEDLLDNLRNPFFPFGRQFFDIEDADEFHFGVEYIYLLGSSLLAFRAGVHNIEDHRLHFVGSADTANGTFETLLFPKGDDSTGVSFGLGAFLFGRFQVDVAADFSEFRDTVILSGGIQF